MRVLALDVGTKTIGLAVSDPLGMFAQPLRTLSRHGVKKDVVKLEAVVSEVAAEQIVVGLPYELDGSEARSARLARQVGDALHAATGLPVSYVDERYSSVEAERRLIGMDLSRKRRKAVVDQAAAVVILQGFLDHGATLVEPGSWNSDGSST